MTAMCTVRRRAALAVLTEGLVTVPAVGGSVADDKTPRCTGEDLQVSCRAEGAAVAMTQSLRPPGSQSALLMALSADSRDGERQAVPMYPPSGRFLGGAAGLTELRVHVGKARAWVGRSERATVLFLVILAGSGTTAAPAGAEEATDCPRDRIVVIAHRGTGVGTRDLDGVSYSENTIPAFQAALGLGADGYETDYRLSREGRIVAHHDRTLTRMTDGTGYLRNRRWAYLRELRTPSGSSIPLLPAVLNGTAGDSVNLQQEIRADVAARKLRAFLGADAALATPLGAHVLITSATLSLLVKVHRIAPKVPVGLLTRTTTGRPVITRLPRWLDVILIDRRAADRRYIRRAHARGYLVSVRNVDRVSQLHRAVAMGADRAVTDWPDRLGQAC